jgi:hydrogenase maturation protein HypF
MKKLFSIPPDLATCTLCWDDFQNPSHRLYQYPFISCCQCGPRWSIMKEFPFDREQTSMSDFPLCEDCLKDYNNPTSRRFHAQTLSCSKCGPKLNLKIDDVTKLLQQNKIGLIKGLTGYHLIGNAESTDVIHRIRQLKARPEKALAIMIKDESVAGPSLWNELRNPIGPLVITEQIKISTQKELAPGLKTLAVMAPPTPLHFFLFQNLNFLVATSANPKSHPLVKDTHDLPTEWLSEVDFVLDNNRVIQHCVDDSILANNQILRRGRGLAPWIRNSSNQKNETVIAWGSDLKTAPAIQTPHQQIQLPYLGELSHPLNFHRVRNEVKDILQMLQVKPTHQLIDAHPDAAANLMNFSIPVTQIFHHQAHAEACFQDHKTNLVFTFDGTGFGEDHQPWGGELMEKCSNGKWTRLLSFEPMPFFAGDEMIKKPYFSLAAMNQQLGLVGPLSPFITRSPLITTSAGRWFDAIAAELFFKEQEITYEAQAAILLEHISEPPKETVDWKQFSFQGAFPTLALAQMILYEFSNRYTCAERAWLAHDGLAYLVARAISQRKETRIGACGGVWQNELLQSRCAFYFKNINKTLHISSPCNDESIALGQLGVFYA